MGSYRISTGVNTMSISCEGVFSPEDGKAYYEAFKKELAKVTPASTHLTFDATKLAASSKDSQVILKDIMELYKNIGFKKVTVNSGGNALLKMQLNRLAAEVGLTNFTVI